MLPELSHYLSGKALIGDDFTPEQIADWFADEKEASYELRGHITEYQYHARNQFYGYRRLAPGRRFRNVLSFGGGNGAELLPISHRLEKVTILESSRNFKSVFEAEYVLPNLDGTLPFPDNTFDLVTCLGVLHHIPNVSTVIRELHRCTAEKGSVLLSEPITSMGDWTKPRAGLTKRERGIPVQLLSSFVRVAGFKVLYEKRFSFGLTQYLTRLFRLNPYNSGLMVRIDCALSQLPFLSTKYHATNFVEKIRPSSVFYVLEKR